MAAAPSLTPDQRAERARKAGQAAQRPETLALKLVRDWPILSPDQQHTLRALLRPVLRNAR